MLHGGHFYGGHVAFAMDGLKTLVANVADLLDRQLALLVDGRYNNGLPQHLSGATGPRNAINHGFKAVQIAASAWTAEALKLTMPASVFSRSTECHNQDKVSMGTIAARDAVRVLELSEQVAAADLIATRQALHLRLRARRTRSSAALGAESAKFAMQSWTSSIPFHRRRHAARSRDLRSSVTAIETRDFALPGRRRAMKADRQRNRQSLSAILRSRSDEYRLAWQLSAILRTRAHGADDTDRLRL